MPKGKKPPRSLPSSPAQRKEDPGRSRLPQFADVPGKAKPKWRLSLLDLDHAGSWSWKVDGDALQKIISFLAEMEQIPWSDIMMKSAGNGRRMHHAQPVGSLCREARSRLQALKLDDADEMFRFRLGGPLRLWGIIDGDVFYPVWWDPDHKVYPVDN